MSNVLLSPQAAATSRLNRVSIGLRSNNAAASLGARRANGFTAAPVTLRISNQKDMDSAMPTR